MSKKSKRKTDVKSSILVLLLIAILLMASTYAWFTANRQVTIDGLNVNVASQNGLQISADGTSWKTVLQNDDLLPTNLNTKYAGNTNQISTVLEPVSSVGNMAADGTMEMFKGTVTSDATGAQKLYSTALTDTQGAGELAGAYIAFDAFFKVDKDSQLRFTNGSSVVIKTGEGSKGLENSARVAFCVLGQTTSQDLATIQGINNKISNDQVYIWEPNSDVHTLDSIKHAKDTYNITTTETGAAAIAYNGLKVAIADTAAVPIASVDTNYFAPVTPKFVTPQAGMADKTNLFMLTAGITKVRIYMWVEGQDIDCNNSASGSNIVFNLQFSIPGDGEAVGA